MGSDRHEQASRQSSRTGPSLRSRRRSRSRRERADRFSGFATRSSIARNTLPVVDIPRFKPDAPADDVAGALLADGAAIVEELVSVEVCERIRDELQPWIDATPEGGDEFSGRST